MERMKETVGLVGGAIGSLLCFLYGELDTPVLVLITAIAVDYATGMINGILNKKLSSETGLKGFFKKVILILFVAFATQLDKVIGSDGMIRNFIIFYYIATEGLSILENMVAMGVPVPEKVKEILEQIREAKKWDIF